MARSAKSKKVSQKSAGASLLGRIGTAPGWKPDSSTGPIDRASKVEGYRVVNGKLLSENDIGVLLRQAGTTAEQRERARLLAAAKKLRAAGSRGGSRGGRQSIPKGAVAATASLQSSARARARARAKAKARARARTSAMKQSMHHPNVTLEPQPNNLIFSTHTDASDKMLAIYNLTLGVNSENLKRVLSKIGGVEIKSVKVRDLPSGSSTATVTLTRPTTEELERVRKLFHNAIVDGRTIQVSVVSNANTSFSY